MNKYQEALDYLFVKYENSTEEGSFLHRHHIDVIRELVDKETSMKPTDISLGNYGNCRICNHSVNYQQNYCGKCGQALDWSKE